MTYAPSIRLAARPFVARALRGARGRRLVALSLLLTALSAGLGTWLAFGTGGFERELRQALDLEEPRATQEMARFVVIADSRDEAARLSLVLEERPGGRGDAVIREGMRVDNVVYAATDRLRGAAARVEAPRGHRELQQRAKMVFETWSKKHPEAAGAYGYEPYFSWSDPREVEGLQAIVARGMTPGIEVYASPLGPLDALRLAGMFAGGALILLLLLAAPVLAGTQMAQETHENTLQPLAGSALRAEELAIGLTAGPLAITAALAGPQLALLVVAAAVVGEVGAALALVATTLAGGAFLVVLAQLAGLALGKVRSPGLVAGGLATILGLLGGVGIALAAGLTARTAGALALLPQASASHALAQTFDIWSEGPGFGVATDTTTAVTLGALGMLGLAFLGLRALARRIGNTSPVSLRGGEALAAAVTAMVLVTCANPATERWQTEEFYLLNLGVLAVPLAILLMMRVPIGDVPAAMRKVPVGRLVGEFFAWSGLYLAAAMMMIGPERMFVLQQPVALLYALWFLGVTALLALRVTAAPLTFASRLWIGVCAIAVPFAFIQAAIWARSTEDLGFRAPELFVLSELSPLLGAVQVVLTAAIPWSLVRALRRPAAAPVR